MEGVKLPTYLSLRKMTTEGRSSMTAKLKDDTKFQHCIINSKNVGRRTVAWDRDRSRGTLRSASWIYPVKLRLKL